MRLEVGDIIKTNYSTGPYTILQIERGCTCPKYLDEIESTFENPAPPSKPHIHLVVLGMCDHHKGRKYWLNGYDDDTLKSVWNDDYLIPVTDIDRPPVQISMF